MKTYLKITLALLIILTTFASCDLLEEEEINCNDCISAQLHLCNALDITQGRLDLAGDAVEKVKDACGSLGSAKVTEVFPEIISSMEKLFKDFTQYAEDNGIVVVDTKFEIFVNAKGDWVLGDEVLTPESSRFISKEDFDAQNYISMDKQILRDFGKKNNWKAKAKDLKAGEKLDVEVPDSIKNTILNGYSTIHNRLSK